MAFGGFLQMFFLGFVCKSRMLLEKQRARQTMMKVVFPGADLMPES